MFTLKADKRDNKNLDVTRKSGLLPAVFYGKKTASTLISVSLPEFLKVYSEAGESSVISIEVGGEKVEALIHDVQYDPVTDKPVHADFYVFDKDAKLEISVPLSFIGVSSAVKDKGAILNKVLHELNIEALPKDLPQEIEVDISVLADFGQMIHAKDIKLPAGVILIENPEEVVAIASEPKVEEEVSVVAPDLASIEVEKKGKKDEEGAEATAEAK